MTKRTRYVPPPPPPPAATPPVRPLPQLRPRRRLELQNFGTDQPRRRVPLPAPPKDWLPPAHDPFDDNPAPARLPEPPENLSEVLRDLVDKYAEPVPDALPTPKATRPEEPKDAGKLLNVPVICTKTDRAFVLVFREARSVFGTRYKFETTLTEIGDGGEVAPSLTVPISSLNWGGIGCPHCRAQCRPIYCGRCQRLACDGQVTARGDDLFFVCAPSCGTRGWVRGNLQTVTGSAGRRSPPAASGNAFICAPARPSGIIPRLPKPR
jgi:hypothetical protein